MTSVVFPADLWCLAPLAHTASSMARPSWLLALLPLLAILAGAGGHSHTSEENRQKAAADAARAVRATERVGTGY